MSVSKQGGKAKRQLFNALPVYFGMADFLQVLDCVPMPNRQKKGCICSPFIDALREEI